MADDESECTETLAKSKEEFAEFAATVVVLNEKDADKKDADKKVAKDKAVEKTAVYKWTAPADKLIKVRDRLRMRVIASARLRL